MSVRSRIYPFLSILFRPVSLFPLPPLPSPLPVEKFTFFRENGLSSNSRSTSLPRVFAQWTCVCVCVCTSVRMQQRSRQVNITVGTKQRELVHADVKWPTFLAVNSIPSTPFVHRHLFRLLTRLIRPFSFSLIPPPTFSHDFFSLLLFLCSCRSSSLPFVEKRQDLPDVSLEEFKTKINRTTKKEGWFHAS